MQKLPFKKQERKLKASATILRKLITTHSSLAELKGVVGIIPNEEIILNTLSIQEAKDSSSIENIITTHDDLYGSEDDSERFASPQAKEVHNYVDALRKGFSRLKENDLLRTNDIVAIQEILEENRAGIRKQAGTVLKNDKTGEVVYTPPQDYEEILPLMSNLESFINDNTISDLDPLIKLAIIHHQFESIHPFYDGNGRTGRIINVLYLVKEKLLPLPIIYLSRYINLNKGEYYKLIQDVRKDDKWEPWILFILESVEETAKSTIIMIREIKKIMQETKQQIRSELPNVYSQDLINNIFKHPYTKIDYLSRDLGITRQSASKYLNQLIEIGVLYLHKRGKDNFYVNKKLYTLLIDNFAN